MESRATVLLIDDDKAVRKTIGSILSRQGYRVLEATDGQHGIELMQWRDVDVVVTDLVMPRREGLGTTWHVRMHYPDVPVIAISGGEQLGMAQQMGASATLEKPFEPQCLLEAIDDALLRQAAKPRYPRLRPRRATTADLEACAYATK